MNSSMPLLSTCTTDSHSNKYWYLDGKFHRTNGPAVERVDGYTAWYINGERHRTDGPAVECANGYKEWRLYGKLHRVDGPAVEQTNGIRHWYLDGERLDPLLHFLKVGELELDKS